MGVTGCPLSFLRRMQAGRGGSMARDKRAAGSRRRRWPWVLLAFGLLLFVLVGLALLAKPMLQVKPEADAARDELAAAQDAIQGRGPAHGEGSCRRGARPRPGGLRPRQRLRRRRVALGPRRRRRRQGRPPPRRGARPGDVPGRDRHRGLPRPDAERQPRAERHGRPRAARRDPHRAQPRGPTPARRVRGPRRGQRRHSPHRRQGARGPRRGSRARRARSGRRTTTRSRCSTPCPTCSVLAARAPTSWRS